MMNCQVHEMPTSDLVSQIEALATRPGGVDVCVACRRRLIRGGDNFVIRLLRQAQPELSQLE